MEDIEKLEKSNGYLLSIYIRLIQDLNQYLNQFQQTKEDYEKSENKQIYDDLDKLDNDQYRKQIDVLKGHIDEEFDFMSKQKNLQKILDEQKTELKSYQKNLYDPIPDGDQFTSIAKILAICVNFNDKIYELEFSVTKLYQLKQNIEQSNSSKQARFNQMPEQFQKEFQQVIQQ